MQSVDPENWAAGQAFRRPEHGVWPGVTPGDGGGTPGNLGEPGTGQPRAGATEQPQIQPVTQRQIRWITAGAVSDLVLGLVILTAVPALWWAGLVLLGVALVLGTIAMVLR